MLILLVMQSIFFLNKVISKIQPAHCPNKTLLKAQRTQGIEYLFNTFSSKQKLQYALKYLSNDSLVLFGRGQGIQTKNNFDKFM